MGSCVSRQEKVSPSEHKSKRHPCSDGNGEGDEATVDGCRKSCFDEHNSSEDSQEEDASPDPLDSIIKLVEVKS